MFFLPPFLYLAEDGIDRLVGKFLIKSFLIFILLTVSFVFSSSISAFIAFFSKSLY